MRREAARKERPWALGAIGEGEEWLACTFKDQPPRAFDDDQLAELLTGADEIWMQAYEGMTLDDGHAWHRYAAQEVEAVLEIAGIPPGSNVLDVGCGDGRHAKILANRGFQVVGLDIVPGLIEKAMVGTENPAFEVADARKDMPAGPFGLAIALYDVIGSSAEPVDDRTIMRNIVGSLKPGGYLIAGVMNAGVTQDDLCKRTTPKTNEEFIGALERLPASSTMETSGLIFDPKLLLRYRGVYYRKEQFEGTEIKLPAELVVRDRRFTAAEVTALARSAGLEVLEVRPVRAGEWERTPVLAENDPRAKELLLVARTPCGPE